MTIPGRGVYGLEHLVMDVNGTLAIDGQPGLTAVRITPGGESLRKAEYVRGLGSEKVVAIGQGANESAFGLV